MLKGKVLNQGFLVVKLTSSLRVKQEERHTDVYKQ